MIKPPKVAIFLSSPTDVQPEREAAERVVARLGGVYAAHVELVLERWERRYYEASKGFQEAIANMDTFDLVVGILWKRIGSELPPERFRRPDGSRFESGTVYELETALASNCASGQPTVYVFKSTSPITYTAERVDEERAQKEALDGWWARTFRDENGHYIAATNSFVTTEDFESKFENCLVAWLEERGYVPSGPVWDVGTRNSPYPGLAAYDCDRSPVFFGRQLAIEQACDELLAATTREGGLPALLVIGASGSGKSSLARAGLVPRITRPGAVAGVDLWRTVVTVPSADSLAPLAAHLYAPESLPELGAGAQPDPARWARLAAGSPESAADTIVWALNRTAEVEGQRVQAESKLEAHLILVVDQLESLFGTSGQRTFTKVLRALMDTGRVWLLATLRSDRYPELQLDPDLLAIKRSGATYDLPPPGPAEIADIVKGPARAAGLIFAEREGRSLAHVLVEAVPNADALPLLQMALAQLFKGREGIELTYAAYEAMSGIDGAIAAQANTVFALVSHAARREFDPLVRALVRDVAHGSNGQIRFTARTVDRKAFETSSARRDLVETLVNGRLLVSDEGNLRVAHEALLRRWDHAKDSLKRLANAELRKARIKMLAAIAAATVFLIVGFVAQHQTQIAKQQEAEAKAQRQAAEARYAESLVALGGSLGQSSRWAEAKARYGEAYRVLDKLGAPTFVADVGLWRAYLNAPPALNTLVGHTGDVSCVAFLPDSRHILSGGADKVLRQWDIATGRVVRTFPHSDSIASVAVSQDGHFAASGTDSGGSGPEVRFLDLVAGKELHAIRVGGAGEYSLHAVAFLPDSRTVLTGHPGGLLKAWDAETGRELRTLRSMGAKPVYIRNVAVSPDGRRAVTTGLGLDGPVVWDLEHGRILRQFEQRAGQHPSFSADGQLVMAGDARGRVHIWEVETGKLRQTLEGSDGFPQGRFLPPETGFLALSGGQDRVLRLWTGDEGATVKYFSDHEGNVNDIDVSPDGRLGVSAGAGGVIGVWDLSYGREVLPLMDQTEGITSIALSHDGQLALSASWDNSIDLWDLARGRLIGRYLSPTERQDASMRRTGHLQGVMAIAFLPDGNSFVSADYEGSIRVWDLTTGQTLRSFSGHQDAINGLAVSPDGSKAASASNDTTVRLWDLQSGQQLRLLPHPEHVLSIAFSKDGKSIFSGSYDGLLRRWEFTTEGAKVFARPDPVQTIKIADGKGKWIERADINEGIKAIAVLPNGKRILTGAGSNMRLWDTQNGNEIQKLTELRGGIDSLALSPDGRWALAGGHDSVWIQEVDSGREVGELSVRVGKVKLHSASVTSVAMSADGGRVISGDESGRTFVWELARAATYRDFEPRLRAAKEALRKGTEEPRSLATLGEWYAFRGVCPWAIELLEKARKGGAQVSALTLAQCHWESDFDAAIRELRVAAERKEIPERHLALYVGGVRRSQAASFVSRSESLQDAGNTVAALEAVGEAITIYEDLARDNASPGLGPDLALAYNRAAWVQLFNRSPKEAIVLATKGLEVAPTDAMIAGNLAHGYLFDNQFDRAKAIYLKYKNRKLSDGRRFAEATLADFVQFKAAGLGHPDIEKIEEALGTESDRGGARLSK